MINRSIFKANDIRGRVPEELNDEVIRIISGALAKRWKKGKVVVAHDARLSSPALYAAITAELKTHSFELVTIGLATTPMFYFLVNALKAVGGAMITASHNPKEYNGLKIVGSGAEVMSGEEVWKLLEK